MAALKIIRLGHPQLRLRSKAVTQRTIHTKSFQTFIDKLIYICQKGNGVGIAAPQVGKNIRVIIVHVNPNNPRYKGKKYFPLKVIINPRITGKATQKEDDWEGDLSADLRALVPRFVSCTVAGFDREGNPVTYTLTNAFHARVFQHEIDHLNGILFIDRVIQKNSISETAMWRKYLKPKLQSVVTSD